MIGDLLNFYSTNFSIAYSPDGKYAAVADRYGKLSFFSFPKISRASQDSKTFRSIFQLKASPAPIYSIATKDDLLICGCGDGQIIDFPWSCLVKQNKKPVFTINANSVGAEINAVLDNKKESSLRSSIYTAGGDCTIQSWDIETKKHLASFTGHLDFVHSLSWSSDNCLVSSSEDGTVRFWGNYSILFSQCCSSLSFCKKIYNNNETNPFNVVLSDDVSSTFLDQVKADVRIGKNALHILKPFESDCGRKNRGKWVGALAANQDWMVCGGGPQLGLWPVGSYQLVNVLESEDIDHHSVVFHEDKIIGCGSLRSLNHWNLKGELVTCVDKTPSTIYDIKFNYQWSKNTILCVCGDGPNIDVFLNLGYSSYLLDTSF